MNRIFRIIWSRTLRTWVVASELAVRHGKSTRGIDKRAAISALSLDGRLAEDLPLAQPWPLRLSIFMALLVLYAPAQAADRYWDPNNTAVGYGGTGTWGTSGAFWSPNSDGVSGPFSAWNNAALDDAFFGGTAGTVTLGGPITVHNITFQTDGYSLTGGSLILSGTNPTLSVTTGTSTIASPITSTSGLTKAGAGALTLNGSNSFGGGININAGTLNLNAANSFTGTINVTGGNLAIGAVGDAALGSIGNVINLENGRTLSTGGTISASRTVNLVSGIGNVRGSGLGGVFYTGAGGMNVGDGIALTNNANNYQGQTQFTTLPGWGGSSNSFSSIADLGVASALGAPTTVTNGTILLGPGGGQALGASALHYTGTGNSSNRNWQFRPGNYAGGAYLHNSGSGTLTLTGAMAAVGGSQPFGFSANSADMNVLGVISSNTGRTAVFAANSGRTIRLGTANTFSGQAQIQGVGAVEASLLANTGVAGSLGTGSIFINGGNLAYVGAGESTNKSLTISSGSLNSNGTGALALGGTVAIGGTATLGGSFTGTDNIVSGVISGVGNLRSAGNATWTLTGINTYTGSTIVDSGVLRAATANAFGASTVAQVNGGTLDLNGFNRTFSTLSGTGGTVNLGSATLTLEAPTGTTASYGGNIAGSGGLTKLGASTQTLTGANTYTGATTIGGGTLNLNFSPAGGPTSNIISNASTLNMSGGTLNVSGAAGESNTQTFNGLNVSAGNNVIGATSGSGGNTTVNLGTITRTGGLMNFNLPTIGNLTTTNTVLGGWATVNGTDYAKVVSGNITAFTAADYTNKDNAANWLNNEFITDATGFFGTVSGSVQLGGLRYTRPVSTTVTINPGQTLGVDGTIIVAPSVLNTNQVITGGMLTGANGGDLGIQQNSTGNFTIASQIVDNGPGMGFVKAGTGLVTLTNAGNSYTGGTTVAQGTLSVGNIGNGGVASGIGASTADSSNLVLEGATLSYTGATTTSDRGFTFAKSGGILGSGVAVTNAATNLSFTGLVTSPDDARFTKSGAGMLTLANGANNYVGGTTVTGGLLSVNTLANGGQASGIGQSSSASANLLLNGGGLQYTGGTTNIDRGFSLGANGGTIDVSNAGTTLTISGTAVRDPAAGNALTPLTKQGDGTLVLSGTNTYIGATTVTGGTLRAGSTQAFGQPNTNNVMTLANTAGVTLDLNNFSNFVGPLNGGGANGGNVTLGSATLRIGGGNGSYAGVISGTGGVWRTDGGTQTFTGCNHTYTGVTNLQGATLSVNCLANGGAASGIGASGSASTNLTFTNGNLNYTGGTVSIDRGFNLVGWGVIDVVNGTTLGFSGQVVGGGELYKDNAGTLVLSGNNTYTNNTRVRGGTLRAGSNTAFGSTNSFWLDNTAGALLDMNDFNANAGALIGGGAAGGNIALGTGTLTIRDGLSQVYAGAISGAGSLIKNGAGLQTLSGCNSSYTGTTTINAGVLAVNCLPNGGVNGAIGASSAAPANLVLNGGTLRYTGAGGSTDRQFTLGTSGGALDASGTGIIEFASTAPVALAGANTARTLTLTGTNTGYNLLAAQLDNNGAGVTSLTKTGTGTWRLTNNNSTYTGITTISGGILSVDQMANGGAASSIGASSNAATNLVIGNGSTLRYTGAGDTTDRQFTLATGVTFIESSGTGALQFTNTGAVTLSGTNTARTIALGGTNTGNNTLGGAIGNNGTGATTLAKNDSGTWILTGNNTYTGNTVINNGNLMIGNGGTTGNAGAGNVIVDSATSTLSINRSDTFNFNGTLSGPGTLAQIGTGTSVLTSASNSIGATTISAGTLQVNGALATPTVTMTGTSALSVTGTVQASGGTQTTLTGDAGAQAITVGTGGTLLASGDLGGGNDTVNLTGTLNTGAGALQLGDGDDTLVLNDGAQILGNGVATSGGSGIDTLVVNTALGYTLDGGSIDTFDILTKQDAGPLTLIGDHDFAVGTNLNGGLLDVDGTLETPVLSMADGTTLNVDGTVEDAASTPATITGSAGTNIITVGTTGTLRADGDLGDGSDVVTLAGILSTGAGTLELGAGNDVLTLQDGSFIEGGGVTAGAGGNDQLVLDNALTMVFDGSQTAGFETLIKQNAGTATMIGSQNFNFGTTINAGALDINGALETPIITLADNTALIVDGTVNGGFGTTATIAGSADTNTITVGASGTLLANGDLGFGNDVLDVAGTLSTGAGVFALGDGDDTLTIHENTNIVGTVSAGAGNDTFDTHIDTVADLGAVQGFETLSKTGIGVLNINGPLSSDFTTVTVAVGTLNITTAGSVVPASGNTLATHVASGATLNVDGSYGCGAGNDSMTVAGTVSGTGTIDLCGGDDTLTLQDGVVLTNAIGGGLGINDTLVLDSASALTFDAGNTVGFEQLQKNNAGTATLTGSQSFTGGTTITGGTLEVDGALVTPTVSLAGGTTLNVDGTLQADGGTAATVTGDAGANTVSVGAGGTLVAVGDLGAGIDTLDVTGTFDTGGGVFALGDGDDNFVVHDGTVVIGTIDGGAGLDTRVYDINTTADLGALVNFEGVTKTGTGVLNVTGPGVTNVQEVQVLGGTLDIGVAGSLDGVQNATVASGATLIADGSMLFTPGADIFAVAGNVSGTGTINMLDGNDNLILQDGADLTGLVTSIDGGVGTDTLTADIAGTATLGGVSNFETLSKTNTGTLIIAGPAPSGFTTVNVDGGTLDVGVAGSISGVITTTVAGGATLDVDGAYSGSAGNDTMTVAGTISGAGTIFFDDGDDVLTLNDGADLSGFSGTLDGGAHSGGDTVALNNAADLTFGAGTITNFEFLAKTNTGTATLTGAQSYSGGTTLAGGELVVDGTLATPTLAMGDGTTLTVDGVLDAGAATATVITGSGGINTVSINGTALITGDLGGGEDVLDVFGTLDTLGGAFALGDGDDSFVVHDGTVVLGTVDGGAGLDTRVYDINLSADVGTLVNFEGITKTGTGVLNLNGAGTNLQEVSVLGGTLNIGPAGSVTAIAGGPLDTVIASGATLRVDGSYGCGASNDTMTVAGTISGTGTIDLCGGEDVLTLQDGAVLTNVISGGSHGSGDTVVLDTAAAFTFDASNTINFEYLRKDNAGEATLIGTQSFTGGTTVNGGTLNVAGQLQTPTMALADNTVLNIDGTLNATGGTAVAISGSAGANTVTVGAGGNLLATGDLGDGNDVLDVAGTLDTAGGTFALGNGDDTLTIHDDTRITGTVTAGEGNDTFNADIATAANLGAVQAFETLSKSGVGVLNVNGPMSSDFTTVNVQAGTLNVTAAGSVAAQNTTVAAGATLNVQGSFTGTAGDDRFTSMGTVVGALAFGDGSDSADFIGGNVSGITTLNGGAGADRVGFSGLILNNDTLPTLANWERVELLSGSELTLGNRLELGNGMLAIDGTSQLLANAGAGIGGSVENAGRINTGANRLAISGGYTGNAGALSLTVSPANGTSGGLDIAGDVMGNTAITFVGDGTEAPATPSPILVISSPNDNRATTGNFTPAGSVDGSVRLNGSVRPWSLGQQADNNWYLSTEAAILPEIGGYAVLPDIGQATIRDNNRLLFQRLSGVRGDTPHCSAEDKENKRAYWELTGDCHGFWVAATGSELEMGANPGFEFSGDSAGLYVGVDRLLQDRETRTLRGGLFAGFQRGNYWTTGVNSTDLPAAGESNVRIDTPMVGMYSSVNWHSGSYIDTSLVGQLPKATIAVADGFREEITGSSLALSTQVGHRFHLGNGWALEPQVELSAVAMSWGDKVDASGKRLILDDDVFGTARAAVRAEKVIETARGARIRSWATFGLQDTVGEKESVASILPSGLSSQAQAFPSHDYGLTATLDIGVEAELSKFVSLFGVLSYDESVEGSDSEQRQANLGVRIKW